MNGVRSSRPALRRPVTPTRRHRLGLHLAFGAVLVALSASLVPAAAVVDSVPAAMDEEADDGGLLRAAKNARAGAAKRAAERAKSTKGTAQKLASVAPGKQAEPRVEQWTPISHTWVDDQGKAQTELFASPHYRRTEQGWESLSGAVEQRKDKRFPWSAGNVAVPTQFGAGGSEVMRLSLPRGEVTMSLQGAKGLTPGVEQVDGDRGQIAYVDALPGVDLGYVTSASGVKEALRIKAASAQRSFTFTIEDPEHLLGEPTRGDDESYRFSGSVGDGLAMSFGAPMAWSEAPASSQGQSGIATAHQLVTQTPAGYEVRLWLDPDWAKTQQFPVVLDPSISYNWHSGTMGTAYAPTDKLAGCSGDYCPLASSSDGAMFVASDWGQDPGYYAGYMRMNLASLRGLSLSTVDAAVLEVGYDSCSVPHEGYGVGVIPMTTALEPGDTWGDAPELPRWFDEVYEDEENEDPDLVEAGVDLSELWDEKLEFGEASGSTASGFERHTVDVTSVLEDWITNDETAGAGFLVLDEPVRPLRPALLLEEEEDEDDNCSEVHDWLTAEEPLFGGWLYDAALRITGPAPLPSPLPVEQSFGCDCMFQHGAGLSNTAADPVNTATGSAVETTTDLATPGPGVPFELTRTYNGLDSTDGSLGVGWTHGFDSSLNEDSLTGDVTFRDPTGGQVKFTALPGGAYLAPPAVTATLDSVSGGWTLTSVSGQALAFDEDGHLVSELDRQGRGITLAYAGSGAGAHLSTATDEVGRVATFGYGSSGDADGKLVSVTTDDGRSVGYGYDTIAGSVHLVTYTDAEDVTTTYSYDATTGQLDGISVDGQDENAQNVYDGGRITEQTDAAGNTWDFDWEPSEEVGAPAGSGTQTTTDPEGHSTVDVYHGNVLTSHTDGDGNTTDYFYDADNNLDAVRDARGFITAFEHDGHGNLTRRTAPASGSVSDEGSTSETWTYNGDDQITSHTDGLGKTTTYSYDVDGQLETVTDPLGHETGYTYNGLGLIETITTPEGRVTEYGYDADGNQTSVTSPGGAVTTYAYDGAGRVISRTDPLGNELGATAEDHTTHYTYDDQGRVLTVTDPLDTVTENAYNADGTLATVTVTDADENVVGDTSYTYDELGRMLTTTEFSRTTIINTYDKVGNLLTTTDAAGATTSYTYTPGGRRATMTTPNGNDPGLDPEADPEQFVWHYEYDEVGNLTQTIDPDGAVQGTTYDGLGRAVQTYSSWYGAEHPDTVVTTDYDAAGRPIAETDGDGVETTWAYDDAGRLVATGLSGQDPAANTYDDDGNRLSATSPSGGSVTTWTYTEDGQIATVVDPNGNASGADPEEHTVSYTYDAAGHRLAQTDQLGHTTTWTYDPLGRRVTETDALSNTTTWAYDPLGRVTSVTTPGVTGGTTSYAYDVYGDQVGRTDPKGNDYSYAYDDAHHLTDVIDPLDRHSSFTYDLDGNQITRTLARGHQLGEDVEDWTVHRYYDRRGNFNGEEAPDGSWTYYYYDTSGKVDYAGAGDASREADTYIGHDLAGRPYAIETDRYAFVEDEEAEEESWYWDQTSVDFYSYTYDEAGRIASRTNPDESTIAYTYDEDGLPASLEAHGQTTDYAYTPAGQLATLTYPTAVGLVQERTYDAAGQVASIDTRVPNAADPASRIEYQRDANGNPTQVMRVRGVTTTYEAETYDALNRITKYCPGALSCTAATEYAAYTYDKNGNRTLQDRVGIASPGTTTYTYDDADELVEADDGTTVTGFEYDAEGRLTSGGREWNFFDELTASDVGVASTYSYDAFGNRVGQVTGGVETAYSWDLNNTMAMLAVTTVDPQGDPVASLSAYGADGALLTVEHAGEVYPRSYVAVDAVGSVTDVFAGDGTAVSSVDYEPFGGVADAQDLVVDPVDVGVGYTGALLDGATGDYYLRARDYQVGLGRLTRPDPVEQTVGGAWVSTYVYVGDMPLRYADPTGLCWGWDWVCQVGKGVGRSALEFAVGEGGSVMEASDLLADGMLWGIDQVPGVELASWDAFGNTKDYYSFYNDLLGVDCNSASTRVGEFFSPIEGLGLGVKAAKTAKAAKGADEALTSVDDVLGGLSKGRSSGVRTVGSDAELEEVYGTLTRGGTRYDVPGYKGTWIERSDGVRVGLRDASKSGGRTIDIRYPDGTTGKIHIE